jgi:hypothetical protein
MTEKLMTEKWRAWFCCRDPTTGKTKMPIKVDTNICHLDQAEFGEKVEHEFVNTHLEGFHWINITRALVTFQSITKP